MPFLQRVIEPENVCRNTLPVDEQGAVSVGVNNELEAITNGTLANIIRQLSSLSKHAEDMFSSLFYDSALIISRTNNLQSRIDRLAVKATHLDSTAEEVSLQDIHMRKAFKSFVLYEQQVVSRVSLPAAIRDIYKQCDKPPPLDKLNPYRDDGKQGLKFYTDSNYFFDLWKQEMLKDTGKVVHDRGKKAAIVCKKHKRSRQGLTAKEHVDQSASSKESEDSSYYSEQCDRLADKLYQEYDGLPIRPNSLELHPAYFPPQQAPQFDSNLTQLIQAAQSENIDNQISSTRFYRPSMPKQPDVQKATTANKRSNLKNSSRSLPPAQQPLPPAPPFVSDSPASSSGSSTPTVSGRSSSSSVGKSKTNGAHSRENLPPPPPPPPTSVIISNQNPISDCEDMLRAVLSASFSAQITSSKKETAPSEVIEEETDKQTNLLNGEDSNDPKEKTPVSEEVNDICKQLSPVTISENSKPVSITIVNHEIIKQPPPPPPPPLPSLDNLVLQTSKVDSAMDSQDAELYSITSGSASETSSVSKFSESADVKSKGSPHTDARSDLLAAIREGIKLRRIEGIKHKEVEKAAPLHDVASILARRVAMEFSDSESPPESEYDSDGWGDEKEKESTKT